MKDVIESIGELAIVLALTSIIWGPLALVALAIIAQAMTGKPIE
jgi:hypothetical protein